MPSYDLLCSHCHHAFEHEQSIHEPILKRCPVCRRQTLEQDYSQKIVSINDGVPRTVGQQAEKNAKEMGRELAALEAERILGPRGMAKRNAPTPPWREKGSKPLDVSKIKDTTKYIMTGEKS